MERDTENPTGQPVSRETADEAIRIAESPAFNAAITSLEVFYIAQWRRCEDATEREVYWQCVQVLGNVVTELKMLHDHKKMDDMRARANVALVARQKKGTR